jgi:hypothetical protein
MSVLGFIRKSPNQTVQRMSLHWAHLALDPESIQHPLHIVSI